MTFKATKEINDQPQFEPTSVAGDQGVFPVHPILLTVPGASSSLMLLTPAPQEAPGVSLLEGLSCFLRTEDFRSIPLAFSIFSRPWVWESNLICEPSIS